MCYPSILAHVANALFVILALAYGYVSFSKLRSLDPYRILIVLLLFSIAIGIHGISHLGLEKEYQYLAPLYSWNTRQGKPNNPENPNNPNNPENTEKPETHGDVAMNCPCMENFESRPCGRPCGGFGCGCRRNCPFMKTE